MGKTYKIGELEFQAQGRRVLRSGQAQPIGARAFDLLMALVEHRDRVVTKDQLLSWVWPGLVVEENNLTVQISALRKVLGPGLISTVPGRGYRFAGELDGDAERAAAWVAAAPPAADGGSPDPTRLKHNLPAVLPPLIGRSADLLALEALVGGHRLVTLLGAGGIGKTTLARGLLAAQWPAYPHGGCWVDLAPLPDGAGLPATLAAAMGVSLGRGEPQAALAETLAPLCLLLVIDNAEHLAHDVAALVQTLLTRVPGLHVLVTSQVPLRLPEEQLFRLGPLALPSPRADAADAASYGAVALFVTRAQAVQRSFLLDDGNVEAVVRLCQALDGNPLAIELAAARLPLLGLARLAEALDQRLRLLRATSPATPVRQQSVLAALEWSYGLLAPREQGAFCRLAVFAGAAELGWIQAVLADDVGASSPTGLDDGWAVIDALAELVDRSLVAVTSDEPPRYRLLESPRALAREKLQQGGESERMCRRHAQVMAAHAERLMQKRLVDADADDLDAAFAWARGQSDAHDLGCALVIGARLARSTKNDSMLGQNRLRGELETLLANPAAAVAGSRAAWAHSALGFLLCDSHPTVAAGHAATAADWFAAHGERTAQYLALCHQALALARLDPASAQRALDHLLALQAPDWPLLLLATGAGAEAKVAFFAGDSARARAALQRQVALRAASGARHYGELANLVMVERAAGHVERALALGLSLVEQLQGTRAERSLNYARLNLAAAAIESRNWTVAHAVIRDGWPAARRFGLYASWLSRLVELAFGQGRLRAAQRLAHAWGAMICEGQVPTDDEDRAGVETLLARAQLESAPDECERLRIEGLALNSETAFELALAQVDD